MKIFVARQPILKSNKHTFGYELLFRDSLSNTFPDIEGDIATSKVLTHTFFAMGLDVVTDNKPALINFTRELLVKKAPLLFPKEDIIIEILENIEPDAQVVESVKELVKKGYQVALDDFIFHKKYISLIKFAKIIKFDLIATPLNTLQPILNKIKHIKKLILLAEKVETYEEFEQAKSMGFSLFQGYFFSKPEILSNQEIASNKMSLLKLIAEVNKSDMNLFKIGDMIKSDVYMSYKLMRFINSAYFSRKYEIGSIKDALAYLGNDEIKKFISMVAAAAIAENKPNELIRHSIFKAKMFELIGCFMHLTFSSDELFTIGLFSNLEAMLDTKMKSILKAIPFSDSIKASLLGNDKKINHIADIVKCFETGDWRNCTILTEDKNLDLNIVLSGFYLESLNMANHFFEG